MSIDTFKIGLQELESNLENEKVINVLNGKKFDINNLNTVITQYLNHSSQIENSEIFNVIESKVKELVSYSNEHYFENYSHKFINNANFLIKNVPKEEGQTNKKTIDEEKTPISEEEFLNRCEKLIEQLGYEHEDPKLILKTQVDEKEFRVFKNKNKSIIYFAENSEKGMPTSIDNLKEIAFKRKEPNRKSYDNVIISKIFDNTIFNEIDKTFDAQLNESLINQIRKHSEELFKLKDDLEVIQKDKDDFNTAKNELNEILTESKTIKQEYTNAKNAAINDAKLKASVDYWDEKKKKHKNQFYLYGIIAIGLIFALLVALYNSNFIHNENSSTIKIMENPTSSKSIKNEKDMEKNVSKEKKALINKDIAEKDNNIIDKIDSIALYALLIFASSSILWIIRIIVKIALSNLHLSEDANERVVMIKTYLSFMKEGNGLEAKDKQLILSSVFRPSSIGIIKDESSITVADIMTSLKK